MRKYTLHRIQIGNLMHCTHSLQQILSQKLPCQAPKPLHVAIARKTTTPEITVFSSQQVPLNIFPHHIKPTQWLHHSQKQLFAENTTCFTRQTVNCLMAHVSLIARTNVLFANSTNANNYTILHIHQLFMFSQHQSQIKLTLFCSS